LCILHGVPGQNTSIYLKRSFSPILLGKRNIVCGKSDEELNTVYEKELDMKTNNLVANAKMQIDAPVQTVWNALVDPAAIKKYMFGTTVVSDWKEGSQILWKGEWQGKKYEDKGTILQLKPGKEIKYSHYSPLAGLPDSPENYHIVTIELTGNGKQTDVMLSQDNNLTEESRKHSEENWNKMLSSLKKLLEGEK
jgi:uncharacterized protein YndB with AHSA1/START domain